MKSTNSFVRLFGRIFHRPATTQSQVSSSPGKREVETSGPTYADPFRVPPVKTRGGMTPGAFGNPTQMRKRLRGYERAGNRLTSSLRRVRNH